MSKRKMIVTGALPYANGSIHLGHLVEYIQADIWVRFQKLVGNECVYICADDTHGTPIMLKAKGLGITPEELIGEIHKEHTRDFADFLIGFDNYYSTNTPENQFFSELIYTRLKENGYIVEKTIEQHYCDHDKMFLPDRLIRGICPNCGAPDQYGDACEICSATYSPTDLKDPHCSICHSTPILKPSHHYFVQLGLFEERLKDWMGEGETERVQSQVQKKLEEWFQDGLKDWDISRDAPYFGFKIPGTEDKYFYVWLDAPVGYMASLKNWAERNGRTFEELWQDEDREIIHFIGKDITYFHCLFWPAMLMGADFRPPSKVYAHGFLTVDGMKMSKSRGTFIKARTYLNHLKPEYLRYYYASKLSDGVHDIDLNFEDFVARVNSDLANRLVNLGSRVINFLNRKMDGNLSTLDPEVEPLLTAFDQAADKVAELYNQRQFSRVLREVMRLADDANLYITQAAPWKLVGEQPERARQICTAGVNLFYRLCLMLAPVVPELAARVGELVGMDMNTWDNLKVRLESRKLGEFDNLVERITPEQVQGIVDESREAVEEEGNHALTNVAVEVRQGVDPLTSEISIDEFMKVDIRVGVVLAAEEVKGASKLLKVQVDLGELGKRQIFAGIRKSHEAASLVGRTVLVAANLAPREMKWGLSEGMILAAGPGGEDVHLATADKGVKLGDRVH